MKRRAKKLLAAIAMLIFNLVVCFSSAFAWFTAARNNDANNIGLVIDANELILTYELYKYDTEEKEVIEIEYFDFNPYDTIIERYNKYTALVLKVNLQSNLFKVNEPTTVTFSSHCTTTTYYEYALSNILYFKSKATTIDETDIYFNVREALEEEDKHTFFTTTKLTDISYDLTSTPVENGFVTIYSVVDYDKHLIDMMGLDASNAPTFTNDISYIRFGIQA